MNKYWNVLTIAGLLSTGQLFAQNEIDALRYGELSSRGTARALSLGGASGSYGADFSSLSVNPAGIGVYRSSELMITPTLRSNKMRSTYLGTSDRDDNARLGLGNFGLVLTSAAKGENYKSSDWKAVSFGVGYNRLADYNLAGVYRGSNSESSLTDIFSVDALENGVDQNIVPPLGFFGYEGFLLYDDLTSIPRDRVLDEGGSLAQSKSWTSKGGADEFTISVGGNYREKLMLGATMGILSYKYERNSGFIESDESGNPDNDFNYLSYQEYLSTVGLGFNIKLGAIYVIDEQFRIGAAVHTPTWSSLNDISDYALTTNTENLKYRTGQTSSDPETFVQPDYSYEYNYNLRTPWRAVLSGTAFLGRNGFVTADYEFVDYASMKYTFDQGSTGFERAINREIKNTFTSGHNLRLGIEGRMDNFMGRLGFAYLSSPYQRSQDFGGKQINISAGLGARFSSFFIDLAYVHKMRSSAEYAYPILASGVPVGLADLKQNNNLVALTLGFKF